MINKKITIAELQKNPRYKQFWHNVNERVQKVRSTNVVYEEAEMTMIVILLSRCNTRTDFENLRKKIYKIAEKMDFWNVKD